MESSVPLCVDLDGTLIHGDMLHETAVGLLKVSPFSVIKLPWVLLYRGKAELKQWIGQQVNFDPALLPYNQCLIKWLKEQHQLGRRLILCTASDQSIAQPIAAYLGFFDEVMASDGTVNFEGRHKAEGLIEKFGDKGFDYAGNSKADIDVWRHSRRAIVVNAHPQLLKDVMATSEVAEIFEGLNPKSTVWAKAFRVHQWLKNVLLFVPLLAAHRMTEVEAWISLLWAFVAFSLCASSVYIANDLLDLESDRRHPRKCKRPFASASLSVWQGSLVAPILLILSVGIATHVNIEFLNWVLVYLVLTCVYSVRLKQLVLVDCMALAILYTLRIIAGAAAVGGGVSFWLLAFSVFLFLSLAFVKRFAELQVQLLNGKYKAHGRGYFTDDAPMIQMLGIASGFVSVLILALYLNSPEVLLLYRRPEWIWGNVPVMVFWISWLWLSAHRGEMHDDPLIFAVKDKVSVVAGVFFAMFLLLGSILQ